jgi:hypothetical protein
MKIQSNFKSIPNFYRKIAIHDNLFYFSCWMKRSALFKASSPEQQRTIERAALFLVKLELELTSKVRLD